MSNPKEKITPEKLELMKEEMRQIINHMMKEMPEYKVYIMNWGK